MTAHTLPLASLVEDLAIYPRHSVDTSYVGQLSEALRSGAQLPPPVVEKGSLRIVDGWHRIRAYRRFLGDGGSIGVDVRAFKTPADLVRFAVEANVTHGRKLDAVDRVRCALMLSEVGFDRGVVALTLHVREEEVQKYTLRLAVAPASAKDVVPGTTSLPLKRSARFLAGHTLTARQATAHSSMPGTSLSLLARQLTTAMRNDLVDRGNEHLMAALEELHTALGVFLAKAPTP